MPFLELFDETLDINSTENYELSVEFGNYNFSFSVLDTLRNKFVLLRAWDADENIVYNTSRLEDIIRKDDFLMRKFRKTSIIIPSPRVTLVPAALYDDLHREEYFGFNLSPTPGEKILLNELTDPDTVVIFSVPSETEELVRRSFPSARICHQFKPLFQFISSARRISGDFHIHLHIEKEFLNLVIFDQNILILCNTFHYKTISDIQYYLLYVIKRLNIAQDQTIFISGRLRSQKELSAALEGYVRGVRYAEPTGNFTFSYVFGQTDLHRFLNLFNVVNCE